MKNFLKSTAIFACIAFMFCACSEDGTEDLLAALVDPPTIDDVSSGDLRAVLKWTVPDDSSIAQCMIVWANDDPNNVDEVRYIDVIPGYSSQYEFTDLKVGTYTAKIYNVGAGRTLLDPVGATAEKYVYGADTYPTRPTILRMLTEWDQVSITWSRIPSDCHGVYVTYTTKEGETKTTGLLSEVNENVSGSVTTVFEDAEPGMPFEYVTAFKPFDGLDTVYIQTPSSEVSLPGAVAADPESITSQSGYNVDKYGGQYFKVKWEVPNNDNICSSTVFFTKLTDAGYATDEVYSIKYGYTYNDEVSIHGEDSSEDIIAEGNINIRYISSTGQDLDVDGIYDTIPTGKYIIQVMNEKWRENEEDDALVSNRVQLEDTITIYAPWTFECVSTYDVVNKEDGDFYVIWDDAPTDITNLDFMYTTDTVSGVYTNISSVNMLDTLWIPVATKPQMFSPIITTGTYLPANGLDYVSRTDTIALVPEYAPDGPSAVAVQPGVSESTGEAYLKASWTISPILVNNTELLGTRLYYYEVGTSVTNAVMAKEYSFDEIEGLTRSGSGALDENGDYAFDFEIVASEFKTGVNYYLYAVTYMESVNGNDIESEKVSNAGTNASVTIYNSDSYSAYTDLPTPSGSLLTGQIFITWSDLPNTDLRSMDITYNGETYYIEVVDGKLPELVINEPVEELMSFSYVANFRPDDGIDLVQVYPNNAGEIIEPDIVYADGIYKVYTGLGLAAIGDLIFGTSTYASAKFSGSGYASFGTSTPSISVQICADIDLSFICGEYIGDWVPLGNSSTKYTGTFDGGNYTISNLYINADSTDSSGTENCMGLFGYISAATISNIKLVNAQVTGYRYVGCLVGYSAAAATITNCHTDGACSVKGGLTIGGICGHQAGASRFTSCTNWAQTNIDTTTGSGWYVGGIAGYQAGASYIVDCHNYGYITGLVDAACIVGYSTGISFITACSNYGDLYTTSCYIGGICGFGVNATIACCYNTAYIETTSKTFVGGISGRNTGTTTITGCYNTGAITHGGNTSGCTCAYIAGSILNADGGVFSCYYVNVEDDSINYEGNENKWGVYTSSTTSDQANAVSVTLEQLNNVYYKTMNSALSDYAYEYKAGDTASGEGPQIVAK